MARTTSASKRLVRGVLRVMRLSKRGQLPERMTRGAAGYDLQVPVKVVLEPRQVRRISLDIAVSVPKGCYGRLAPRSSWTVRGLSVLGGVVDSDYTGPLVAILMNHGDEVLTIEEFERPIQLIIEQIAICRVREVTELRSTGRGQGGFGSTDESSPTPPPPSFETLPVPEPSYT